MGFVILVVTFMCQACSRSTSQAAPKEVPPVELQAPQALAEIKITGGAWVEKKSGNSDILRGLEVCVLRADANIGQAISLIQACLEEDKKVLHSLELMLEVDKKFNIKLSGESDGVKSYNRTRQKAMENSLKAVKDGRAIVALRQAHIAKLEELSPTGVAELKKVYVFYPRDAAAGVTAEWKRIVAQQLVSSTATDIDGKYEIRCTNANLYLYARYETDYSLIEWLIPIDASATGELKIDLQNSNAALITNKSRD